MIFLRQLEGGNQVIAPVVSPHFQKQADVVVCGLGTAGSLAALYAAQEGLSVVGIEEFTCVGGTHTAGGVRHHYFGLPGGRHEKLDQEVLSYSQRYTCTTIEGRKFYMEKALQKQHVQILYEATVCGVYLDDHKVIGVQVLTAEGIMDYGAKLVMDCTAEASVAAIAGCETTCGRQIDGQMQPFSIVSMAHKEGKFLYTNVDFGRVNQYDPVAYSQAILFSRSYNIAERHQNQTLIAQMPLVGLREGRRIIPEEAATVEDLFADVQTQTPMYHAYADLDKHGWDIAFDGEMLGDWAIGANLGAYNVTVAVPYKALLPRGYDGILVPCRALGVDRDISSCVRMLPDMKKVAECAALWASLSIKQNLPLHQVPYGQLRKQLILSGCLNEDSLPGYRIDGKKDWDGTPMTPENVSWITDPSKLEERLKTEKPGLAIWSAKRIGTPAAPVLQSLLNAENEHTRKHAAFALAILGSNQGAAQLREMVRQRDGFLLKDSRKNNNPRGCIAIYWLGRLADREITWELSKLICDPKEAEKAIYQEKALKTTRYEIADFQGTYFQFMTQAVMALLRIGDAHPDLREEIAAAFTEAFSTDAYYERITKRPKKSSEGGMVLNMKHIALSAAKKWRTK